MIIPDFASDQTPSQRQLDNWIKRFPDADTNKDGKLTVVEAKSYRDKLRSESAGSGNSRQRGAPREFKVDPGWERERFPDHAVGYLEPEQIAAVYRKGLKGNRKVIERMGRERNEGYAKLINTMRDKYSDRIFILPTSDAMVPAAKKFIRRELPQIEGLHSAVGKKEERALWRDELGHRGPGFDRLQGYVFYAALYGRAPVAIEKEIEFPGQKSFPGPQLDRVFREIALEAVIGNPLSGIVDKNADGIGDAIAADRE